MKLLFKQRLFSWFDSYDIFDEQGNKVYTVKGELAWGHLLRIYDAQGNPLGSIKERVFALLPKFEMYLGEEYLGFIQKEFTLFKPRFNVDCKGWTVKGELGEWDYEIFDRYEEKIATISKEIFRLADTYVIDVHYPSDALCVLMLALAIDAEKCSRRD